MVTGHIDRVVCAVGERPPRATRTVGDERSVERQLVQRLLSGSQAGSRRQHAAPELGLPFIDTEQAAADGLVEGRCQEIGGLSQAPVPGMDKLVRDQIVIVKLLGRIEEVACVQVVLALLEMLDATRAQGVERDDRVALLPNLFATDRIRAVLKDKPAPVDTIALRRIGEPSELGWMATVLLSPVASYVTGAAISIDGGQLKSL